MKKESIINVRQYSDIEWHKIISLFKKEQIINSTSSEIQNHAKRSSVNAVFQGRPICFDLSSVLYENAKVCVDNKMRPNACGEFVYGDNIIKVNKIIFENGKMTLETGVHETTHKLQNVISTLRNQYNPETPEYEYSMIAYMSNTKHSIQSFGMQSYGRLYISGCEFNLQQLTDISSTLYILSPMERHACLTSISMSEQLENSDLSKSKLKFLSYSNMYLANAILNFKDIYHCQNLSIAQIYQTIDNAQTFIAFGHGISTDLEANVAYDMMALIEYENSELSYQESLNVLYKRLNYEEKRLSLSNAGYSIIDQFYEQINGRIIKNDLDVSFLTSIQQLKLMPINDQIANPIMMANFAFEKDVNVFQYLHCPEVFDEWLFSESSLRQLPKELQEGLGEILGDKYSLANRQSEISKRLAQHPTQEINEDVGYVFERDDR